MKKCFAAILCAQAMNFGFTASGAVIGQWDFDGTLASSVGGSSLVPGAVAPASTPAVAYASVIIGGQTAQVASFTRGTFFRLTHGFAPNAGGFRVNDYTLI